MSPPNSNAPDAGETETPVVWQHREHIAQVESVDRTVLLDLNAPTSGPLILNGTAAAIWRHIDGELSERELCARVADDFEVPGREIEEGVRGFIADMVGRGFLRASNG